MASASKKTELIRKRKLARQGTKRKAQVRSNGTTKTKAELFGDE